MSKVGPSRWPRNVRMIFSPDVFVGALEGTRTPIKHVRTVPPNPVQTTSAEKEEGEEQIEDTVHALGKLTANELSDDSELYLERQLLPVRPKAVTDTVFSLSGEAFTFNLDELAPKGSFIKKWNLYAAGVRFRDGRAHD